MTNDISKKKVKSSSEKKAKRKVKRRETYAMYIYKVLKQVGKKKSRASRASVVLSLNELWMSISVPFKGPSGHGHFQQSHEHHELLREWHLWAHRQWGLTSGSLQQALHHHLQGDPDRRPPAAAWWAGQARRVRGHQGCDQVHQLQVNGAAVQLNQWLF